MDPNLPEPDEVRAVAHVTDALLAHLQIDDLLAELLERVAEVLAADSAVVLLLDESGEVLVPRASKGLEEEVERGVRVPVGQGFGGRIVSERRAIALDEVTPTSVVSPVLIEKGVRSMLGAPLIVEGRVTGVLEVGMVRERRFSKREARLLQLVADRAALALEHARGFALEHAARTEAERATARLAALSRVTDAVLAHLQVDDLLKELLERVTEAMSTDTAAVLLLDEAGRELIARAAKGLEEEVERGVRIPVGQGFAGRITSERRPIVLERVDHQTVLNPVLLEKGVRSLLGVPLIVERRVLGVLHVGTLVPRHFDEDDVALLQRVGDRAALALEHARLYERERAAAEELQRSLMPQRLPELVDVRLSARYRPARQATAVGGDWYDAIPLGPGRLGLVVGDVVGHGLEAASSMGALRSALRAYALLGLEPAEVIRRLDRFAWTLEPRPMGTVAYGIADTDGGVLRLASAGHPPPVLRTPDGRAQLLEARSVPLGVSPWATPAECEVELERGSTLLLYTDGVVERRDEPLEDGLERLRAVCEAAPPTPEGICDAVLAAFVSQATPDDVALLAVQPLPVAARLELDLPAEPAVLSSVRRAVDLWLTQAGAGRDDIEAVRLACTEACANAIEHAYGPAPAQFRVEGAFDGPTARLEVRDFGRWRAPRGRGRGRGLRFIEEVMDGVEVRRDEHGTAVRMSRQLRGAGTTAGR